MTILDRYVLNKFLLPFFYCFLGFIAIWFVFDLSENLQDFLQGKAGVGVLLEYYGSQIPEIIVMCLPIAALLSLLYSLTAMSRSNEIISMLTAGRSVVRILLPLMIVGGVLTLVTAAFNFEAAPHAAEAKKVIMRDIKRGERSDKLIRGHLFRNRKDNRTWFARVVYLQKNRLEDIQIIQQSPEGDIQRQWYANRADFNDSTKEWILTYVRYIEMDPAGEITKSDLLRDLKISGWSETPWRIASSVMNPDYLGVEELRDYLNFNSDFPSKRLAPFATHLHYRYALPLACVVVIFLAAPMGIVYSRRGILGGVAVAIGLFFSMVFISSLFIALGKGGRIPAIVAAWGPILIFFGIGLFLLWLRSTNRELARLRIPGF